MNFSTEFIVVGLAILVLGPAITLIWWRIADKWADEEHRRFKRRDGDAPNVERVVVKDAEKGAGEGE